MPDIIKYGTLQPVIFKLIDTNGDAVVSAVFSVNGAMLKRDNNAWQSINTQITNDGKGWYKWTPASVTLTQCRQGRLNIVGTGFKEDGVIFQTGGNPNAYWNGQ